MKYSQNEEQHHILNYFQNHPPKHGGRLLDIGAYDGVTFSNTHALMRQGWRGVFVEASPSCFASCRNNLHGLDSQLCLATVVIDPVTSMIDFYDNEAATATISKTHMEQWKHETPFNRITVMPVHYKAILSRYGTEFDFVNVDVEGQSADLFLRLIQDMPDVDLWVVEKDNKREEIIQAAQGFGLLYECHENLVLGRKKIA